MIYGMKVSLTLRMKNGQIKEGCGITREYCVKRSYDVACQGYLDLCKLNHLNPLRSVHIPCFCYLTRLILRRLAGVC